MHVSIDLTSLLILVQEWQVCQATVGVLGDVCRAIEDQIAPFTEHIMTILLHNLESADVQRNIKPQILSAFGDIALAIGDRFEACVTTCLHMLSSAQVSFFHRIQSHDCSTACVLRCGAYRLSQKWHDLARMCTLCQIPACKCR